ncbi:MAG: sensor histidine kinase [Acidimicrobiales bacterium]
MRSSSFLLLRPAERITVLELLASAHEADGNANLALSLLEQLVALQQRTNRLGNGLVRAVELVGDNDRLLDQNDELAERNSELVALQKENDLVMSLVANDLRGSLSSLLLASTAPGRNDERLPGIVNRFNRIISQLAESVDIETDRDATTGCPCNLSELAAETIAELVPVAERKRISIESDLEPDLIIDVLSAAEVTSIVSNLVSNAVKYCSAGDLVTISLRRDSAGAILSVADTGPGIDAADTSRIFEKFERLDRDPTDGESTSGLGLYIVRRLVDFAGGSCGVYSEGVGEGCLFWAVLPLGAV